MKLPFDHYTYRARFLPALLVTLPVALAVTVWFPLGGALWGLVTACGGTMLLSQFGRDRGKRKEHDLFKGWGGIPTTRMLRHRHTTLESATISRYHKQLSTLLSQPFPTPDAEKENPKAADDLYGSAVKFLLERTRDKEKFSLVYSENVSYGFRRNLWGMKTIGIVIALCGAAACGLKVFTTTSPQPIGWAGLTLNIILLLCWLAWINKSWVRIPADAYAKSLLACLDSSGFLEK